MAEERVVFDFTTHELREDFEEEIFEFDYQKYISLRSKNIEYYLPKEVGDKVVVTCGTDTGEEYECIYHKRTLSDIEKMIKNKERINLRCCYIKDFEIEKVNENESYELLGFDAGFSFWDGYTSFEYARFADGDVSFLGATFSDEVSFESARFGKGDINFWFVLFGYGTINFSSIDFGEGNVRFTNSRFKEGYKTFSGSKFGSGDVSFREVQFNEGDVSFKRAIFGEGDVIFYDAQFGDGKADFSLTTFGNGDVVFDNIKFGKGDLDFTRSKFGKGYLGINFSKFGEGNIKLAWTQFNNTRISFSETVANNLLVISTVFENHIDLSFKSINCLWIQQSTLDKTIKIAGKPKDLVLDIKANLGQIYFADNPSIVISALEDSIKRTSKNPANSRKLPQFTLIKENYHALGEYDGEDLAYRTYMKYKTSAKWYRWPLKFFNLVGGYGTKPLRIIITMLVAWFGFAGAYFIFLNSQFKPILETLGNALYFSGITFLTIGYGDIWPLCGWAKGLAVAEGFIGLFLMSYLTVAVVRKLLR